MSLYCQAIKSLPKSTNELRNMEDEAILDKTNTIEDGKEVSFQTWEKEHIIHHGKKISKIRLKEKKRKKKYSYNE